MTREEYVERARRRMIEAGENPDREVGIEPWLTPCIGKPTCGAEEHIDGCPAKPDGPHFVAYDGDAR